MTYFFDFFFLDFLSFLAAFLRPSIIVFLAFLAPEKGSLMAFLAAGFLIAGFLSPSTARFRTGRLGFLERGAERPSADLAGPFFEGFFVRFLGAQVYTTHYDG